MPKQKDLKRLVRSRMKKTGESYTAARAQLVRKCEPTRPNYAELAGMSDTSVRKSDRSHVGTVGRCARSSGVSRKASSGDREIRFVARHPELVVPDGHRRLRAHSRPARSRTAPGRRIRGQQEPHVPCSRGHALQRRRQCAKARPVAAREDRRPLGHSAEEDARELGGRHGRRFRIHIERQRRKAPWPSATSSSPTSGPWIG